MPCQVDFDLVSEYFDSNNAPHDMGIELSIEVNTDDETQDVFFSQVPRNDAGLGLMEQAQAMSTPVAATTVINIIIMSAQWHQPQWTHTRTMMAS